MFGTLAKGALCSSLRKLSHTLAPLAGCLTNVFARHRLSTITHADQIIVLNAGTVVEKGTHDELLSRRGRYASMWEKQIRAERALDAAREAQLKAKRAMRRANMRSETQTETSRDEFNSLVSSGALSNSGVKQAISTKSDEITSASSSGSSSNSDTESTHSDERSDNHTEVTSVQASTDRHTYS
jgi:ATP-binding cassette, subfamily B, vacuolar membrane transporter HMT1/ACLQ